MQTVQDDYTGDGITTQFGVSFPYLEQGDVEVAVDGVVVPYTLVGPNTVEVLPAPVAGSRVRVLRRTGIDTLNYEFQLGAAFLPRYIDSNNKQLLYAVQESRSVADTSTSVADAALVAAEYAVGVADVANENATEAAVNAAQASEDAAAALAAVEQAGVGAFNGRSGLVFPEAGDYSAGMISFGESDVGAALSALGAEAVRQTDPSGAAYMPAGSTDTRPAMPVEGQLRYNTDTGSFEGYREGAWGAIGGAAGDHVLSVKWEASRDNIGDGYTAADGQLLSRETYPDVWAAISAGKVPVVTDAEWVSDPTKRGMFTSGDGSTTFRLPDYNGKFAGSLGAVFLRGDGALSAGTAGTIQRDAMQGHRHRPLSASGAAFPTLVPSGGTNTITTGGFVVQDPTTGDPVTDGTNGTPRVASETRPLNVTGCWVIKLFGGIVNVGAADASQLAGDYASLAGRVGTLESKPSIGWGQSWVDVTADRLAGVTFTNSTGRPITVSVVSGITSLNYAITLSVADVVVSSFNMYRDGGQRHATATGVVPPGATYRVTLIDTTIGKWLELR